MAIEGVQNAQNNKTGFDPKRVSRNVQDQVNSILKEGKKIAGSADEAAALQQLALDLEANGANRSEIMYVQGMAVEYRTRAEQETEKAEAKKQKNEVSQGARDDLKNVMGKNKKIDDAEASQVLDMIKNVRGMYSKADIEYFKQELIKAGFGALLEKLEKPNNIAKENNESQKDLPDNNNEATTGKTPVTGTPVEKTGKPVEKTDKPVEKTDNPGGIPISDNMEIPLPKTDTSKELTGKEILEAKNAGRQVAKALAGYTSNVEQALVIDYTTNRLSAKNFKVFMQAYNEEGTPLQFFEQVKTELFFNDKQEILTQTAKKMKNYLAQTSGSDPETKNKIKIIDGILAKGAMTLTDTNDLDKMLNDIIK